MRMAELISQLSFPPLPKSAVWTHAGIHHETRNRCPPRSQARKRRRARPAPDRRARPRRRRELNPNREPWRTGPRSFGIFDTFDNEAGRKAHLEGRIAQALMGKADELLASPPDLRMADVLAVK
jgi:hypothetical protein